MTDIEQFIQEEEKKASEARKRAQELIDAMGIPLDTLQEMAKIDLNMIDPHLLQQLELSLGAKITDFIQSKPTKTASTYRQRGRGIAV